MSTSPAVQEARKTMQIARLEQKGKKTYAKFYAAQPFQVEAAKKNAAHRATLKAFELANEALEIAEITGEGLNAAKEAQAIAALVVERSTPVHASSTSNLSGA